VRVKECGGVGVGGFIESGCSIIICGRCGLRGGGVLKAPLARWLPVVWRGDRLWESKCGRCGGGCDELPTQVIWPGGGGREFSQSQCPQCPHVFSTERQSMTTLEGIGACACVWGLRFRVQGLGWCLRKCLEGDPWRELSEDVCMRFSNVSALVYLL
jgi:hypothetical protein